MPGIISSYDSIADLAKNVYFHFSSKSFYVFSFADFNSDFSSDVTSPTFFGKTAQEIEQSMRLPLGSISRCPCGSGRKYGECHSPTVNSDENNLWKGPGFRRYVILGYPTQFDGVYFQKERQGEIFLTKRGKHISICKYHTIDFQSLTTEAILRSVSITETTNDIRFSGILEITEQFRTPISFVIGASNINMVSNCYIKPENDNALLGPAKWAVFMGKPSNPMEGMLYKYWYRFFMSEGYLVTINNRSPIKFDMHKSIDKHNVFTITLPFNKIEVECPTVQTKNDYTNVSLELEREEVYWDLMLNPYQFREQKRDQKDSLLISGSKNYKKANLLDGVRQTFYGPRKLIIILSNNS